MQNSSSDPILLTEADVRSLLTIDDLIEAMAAALADFSTGRVTQPLRTVLTVGDKAFYGVMPAYLPAAPALGTKLVTVFGSNAQLGMPTHLATIVLLDPRTGALLALMDGRYITEARTAAASAVSVKHLARPNARVLAICGAGVQARSHLEAITRVRTIDEVRIWSRTRSRTDEFVADMQPHVTGRITAAASAEEAVRDADIVVLATAAKEPVVRSEWIAAGAHVCAVGACRPTEREMDGALVARADVYVDSRTGALAEAGDIVLAVQEGAIEPPHIRAEIGDVVAGLVPGRVGPDAVTIFKSLGMAVEDVAAAHLVYTRARERGKGIGIHL
ncbi:MAG TPA: ornithine cyclodeaminase family protein [Vicinamibacterales bacterium]|nr:ornithine cyclodeaminase family protein [Vicinamibacterales bacterium]